MMRIIILCIVIGGVRYLFYTTSRTFRYARSLSRRIFIGYVLFIRAILYRGGLTHESILWIVSVGQLVFLLDYRTIALIGLCYLLISAIYLGEGGAISYLTYGGMYCSIAVVRYQGTKLYISSKKRFN